MFAPDPLFLHESKFNAPGPGGKPKRYVLRTKGAGKYWVCQINIGWFEHSGGFTTITRTDPMARLPVRSVGMRYISTIKTENE